MSKQIYYDLDVKKILDSFPSLEPLGRDEALRIAPLAKNGDKDAVLRMLGAVARTAVTIAAKYHHACNEVTMGEYVQAGFVSLLKGAIPKFDPERTLWNTYSRFWLTAGIGRTAKYGRLIVDKRALDPGRTAQAIEQDGITEAQFWLRQTYISLYTPVTRGSYSSGLQEKYLIDTIAADEKEEDPYRYHREQFSYFIKKLEPHQAYILLEHYRHGGTLASMSKLWGVSRERVRQMELEALAYVTQMMRQYPERHLSEEHCIGFDIDCPRTPNPDTQVCPRCWKRLEKFAKKRSYDIPEVSRLYIRRQVYR